MIGIILGLLCVQAAQFMYFYDKINNVNSNIKPAIETNRSMFSILYGNK